jgi:hypothetical protein
MQTVKNLQELRDIIHGDLKDCVIQRLTEVDAKDIVLIAKTQGFYECLMEIDEVLRCSLKYRDDTE